MSVEPFGRRAHRPAPDLSELERLAAQIRELDEKRARVRVERDRLVLRAVWEDVPYRVIAAAAGVAPQRVAQIVARRFPR